MKYEINYEYLLHCYLEGIVEPNLRKTIEEDVASNPALREELALQTQINLAAKRDAATLKPTPSDSERIFSRIRAESHTAPHPPMGSLGKFGRTPLATALRLALGTFVAALLLRLPSAPLPSKVFEAEAARAKIAENKNGSQTSFAFALNPPNKKIAHGDGGGTKSTNNDLRQTPFYTEETIGNNRLSGDSSNADLGNADATANFEESITTAPKPTFQAHPALRSRAESLRAFSLLKALPSYSRSVLTSEKSPLGITLKSGSSFIAGKSFELLGNNTFGVQYDISDQATLLLEAGSETFSRSDLSASQSLPENFSFERARFSSGTFSYRQLFPAWAMADGRFVPFVQTGVGAVGKDGLLRGGVGFEWAASQGFSLTAAADYALPISSSLRPKFSLSYGFTIRLDQ